MKNQTFNFGGSKRPHLILTKGLPASGKTAWAEKFVEDNEDWVRVSADDYKFMFKHDYAHNPILEEIIIKSVHQLVISLLRSGFSIIVDNNSLGPKVEEEYDRLLKKHFPTLALEVEDKFMKVPLDICLKRNLERDRAIPEHVIYSMHHKYIKGKA